ncbi:MAG: class E sortase [Ornithinimicrobium sp.]
MPSLPVRAIGPLSTSAVTVVRTPLRWIGAAFVAVGVALVAFGGYVFWGSNIAGDQAAAEILQRATEQLNDPAAAQSASAASVPPVASAARGQSVQPSHGQWAVDEESAYAHGDTVAVVSIPSIDVELPVLEGVEADILDQGVLGHYPGTTGPGSVGNFAVAGHRTTHGAPLYDLNKVAVGDSIIVQTPQGWDVFTMARQRIVDPDAVEVVAAVPDDARSTPTQRWMVLTSCHPKLSAAQRIVVYARLDRHLSLDQGPPAELGTAG